MSEPVVDAAQEQEKPSEPRISTGAVGRALLVAAGVLFWGWLLLRWANDWLGGLLVPVGQPFVAPETIESFGAEVPGLAGAFDALAFAVEYLPTLSEGLWLTLVLTVLGIFFGFFIAVPLSVARVYGNLSKYVSLLYTELLRGTPLLAQLFVLYFGLDISGYVPGFLDGVFANNAAWAALVGFVLNSAAYQAEYIRSALQSVDTGQLTAGRAIGLSKVDAIRYVVLPQGLRFAIPGWTNELIYLIKYSSLAAFITVPELFKRANDIASSNFRYTAMFTITAVLYLALVITASRLMNYVEDRTSIPGLGSGSGR
ncbi:amino acid ABC transporter permease [Haloprofundus halophilus]|uniref:amino acid ABC transporter permease n=1 Tax=Haloprofundus halophilus TaxID=2283527 RepID=UPI000E43C278|nr:amino acid ABC transporter permease [Haloprofundus halophilus]